MSQMHTHHELEFDLHDRLRKAMRLSGKSVTDMATDLGIHRNTVNNYLSNKTPLDRRTLMAWALVTGVPPEWLENGVVAPGDPDPDGGQSTPRRGSDAVADLAASKRARHGGLHTRRYPLDRVAA